MGLYHYSVKAERRETKERKPDAPRDDMMGAQITTSA